MNYSKLHYKAICFSIFVITFLLSSCSSEPFKIVLLPDTQTYTVLYPEIFHSQTRWIAENAENENIAYVLHQGDITDWNAKEQWEVATSAFSLLDGKISYTIVPGNHDTGNNAETRDTQLFNTYFPYSKYSKTSGFGGAFEEGKMDNTWSTFNAGGLDWLILSLEFGPRNKVVEWAGNIIQKHPKHKVIINTHAYMYSDDTRMGEGDDWLPQSYGVGNETGENAVNNGEQLWEKLVQQYPNVLLVVSGHVLHRGSGTLVSAGIHGNNVYQMLANYQGGVDGTENGGNGFLRIITINPKEHSIDVKTYSPHINEYKTTPDQQFKFENVQF